MEMVALGKPAKSTLDSQEQKTTADSKANESWILHTRPAWLIDVKEKSFIHKNFSIHQNTGIECDTELFSLW